MIFSTNLSYSALLIAVLLYVFHKYISRNFDYWKKRNVFYIEPVPFLGNFLDIVLFRITVGEFMAKLYNKTRRPFFGIFVFGTPHLVIRSPDLIKSVLVRDFSNFDDRTILTSNHEPVISNTMFVSKNPEWKSIRTKMTHVYTSGKLKGMVGLMNEVGQTMTNYIEKKTANKVDAKELCAKFSTDVIAKCAFGINAHSFDSDEDSEFRKVGRMVFDFNLSNAIQQTAYFFLPNLVNILHLKFINPKATDFMNRVFWKTIEQREQLKEKRNDVIDAIVEMKQTGTLSDENKIVAQAVQFFVAGSETTSATMAFTLYELSLQPHIQTRLREEIKSACQQYGQFTYEAFQSMKYLQMCISETLRKYPVLPFLDRRCRSDYKIPGSDVIIEKGTPIYIPMFGLHYDPEYFPNPEQYDPERFSEANIGRIRPFSYLPFGEGPRNCIGSRFGLVSTKLGLAHILSKFEVAKSTDTPVRMEFEPKSFVLASKTGLPVKFRKHLTTAG